MALIIFISVFVFHMLSANIEGIEQGFYYHCCLDNPEVAKHNLHPIFVVQRGISLLFSGTLLYLQSPWLCVCSVVSWMLCFSFMHNGAYYVTRHRLDPTKYPKGWTDDSTTSTALLNFSYRWRLIHFIIGFAVFLTGLFISLCASY